MNNEPQDPFPLAAMLSEFPLNIVGGDPGDAHITGIVMDNRKVQPGNLFVALKGSSADGHDFIPDAIQRGAAAVVGDRVIRRLPVPYVQVENSRQALTWLAAAFYGNPGCKLTVIGITGTDGKTTTCNLLYKILLSAGIRAGMISTVNAIIGEEVLDTGFHVTTPEAPDVQCYLARMVTAGLTHVVLETTSHGLAQYRVDACEFDVGVVTNITHEHLDQHGSYEDYLTAKARLFQMLVKTLPKPQGNPRLSVLNRDDSSYEALDGIIKGPKVNYGLSTSSDVRAEFVKYSPAGICFEAVSKNLQVPVTSPLMGKFNVSNILAALSVAICGLGINPQAVADGIASMQGVPGRMERIELNQPFTAIVDFAHTPNALRVAIETARQMIDLSLTQKGKIVSSNGRVIVIFGSAGLRDREKRRMMAEVATELADISILTAEDPRTEPLESILNEMATGASAMGGEEGRTFWCIPDRGEALRLGVRLAKVGDIVLACGKGHEQSMCFGTTEFPWDDRVAMRAALSELMGIAGPRMPFLPTQE